MWGHCIKRELTSAVQVPWYIILNTAVSPWCHQCLASNAAYKSNLCIIAD